VVTAEIVLRPADFDALRGGQRSSNMKELERHLGVSYPKARALRPAPVQAGPGTERPAASTRVELLERLARGEIALDQAMEEFQGR
jgi:hypothetical protein